MARSYRTCLMLFPLAVSMCAVPPVPMWAQTLGTVSSPPTSSSCPSGTYSNQTYPAVCSSVTVSCPNTTTATVTYSVDTPPSPKGTIVEFSGGGGTTPSDVVGQEYTFAQDYFNAHYQVVQFAWSADWENTNLPPGPQGSLPNAYNIGTAACRPATFLNYVYTNYFLPIYNSNSFAGMCAQGGSAGSAAVAYSMVWYNAATYLNNAELLSGPVFGDIKLGCQVPYAGNVNVCSQTPTQQYGCSPGTVTEVNSQTWLDAPQYIDVYATAVQGWTGDPKCANTNGQQTSSAENANWKAMSLVTGNGGDFSFSTIGMAGWMCYSSVNCTNACPNNSAAEGEQFYQLFTSSSNSPAAYILTGIQSCNGAEGVAPGTDPDDQNTGQADIEKHMKNNCHH